MTRTFHHPSLRTIPRASLAAQAADALREYILTSELSIGARLPPETELASALGVSRNVLRQAVASLQTLGVLRVVHGSGTYITDVADSHVLAEVTQWLHAETLSEQDYFEVRRLWDKGVYTLAMQRATPEDLDRISALADAISHAPDEHQRDVEHSAFHNAVLEATGNPFLVTVDSLLRRLFWEFGYRQGGVRKPPAGRLVDSHRHIADLLRAGDPCTIDAMIDMHLSPG